MLLNDFFNGKYGFFMYKDFFIIFCILMIFYLEYFLNGIKKCLMEISIYFRCFVYNNQFFNFDIVVDFLLIDWLFENGLVDIIVLFNQDYKLFQLLDQLFVFQYLLIIFCIFILFFVVDGWIQFIGRIIQLLKYGKFDEYNFSLFIMKIKIYSRFY